MSNGEIILYTTEDGRSKIQLRTAYGTIWLTQLEMADLFQTTKQNISLHIKNILEEKEQDYSVVKEHLTTASDGKNYKTKLYNLSMILSVGYRVASVRGTQFRQWATMHLQEYLVKGFVMDDVRLKDPQDFDEWLQRIQEIRASEKRFYQKVRDIYATAVDYDPKSDQAQLFFRLKDGVVCCSRCFGHLDDTSLCQLDIDTNLCRVYVDTNLCHDAFYREVSIHLLLSIEFGMHWHSGGLHYIFRL
jgi:hypothetical protein